MLSAVMLFRILWRFLVGLSTWVWVKSLRFRLDLLLPIIVIDYLAKSSTKYKDSRLISLTRLSSLGFIVTDFDATGFTTTMIRRCCNDVENGNSTMKEV